MVHLMCYRIQSVSAKHTSFNGGTLDNISSSLNVEAIALE